MDELDPGTYRYANEDKINHKIDSFPSADRNLIKEYININRAQKGIKLVRVVGILDGLKAWRVVINKPFKKWTRNDIYEGVNHIRNKTNYKTSTAIIYVSLMKSFVTWMIAAKYSKIPLAEIKKIELPKSEGNSFKSGDILTEEEVKIILSCCSSERDRALISLLYDGGFRMIEAAMMTWADLDFQFPERITARTSQKTYIPRTVSLMSCKDLMSAWREHYPGDPNGNNPVFVTRDGTPFKYNTAYEVIKGIRKRAIAKGLDPTRIKLHQFRRASITHEVNKGRPISHICIERWGRAYSPQIEVYAQPSEQDVLKSKMDMLGIEPKRNYVKRKTAMQPISCPKCGFLNGPTIRYCGVCGRSLSEDVIATQDDLMGLLSKIAKDEPERLLKVLTELPPKKD